MYLTDPVLSITYESGNTYIASIERETDKIRVFWEAGDENLTEQDTVSDKEFECFTVFDARTDTGDYHTIDELQEKAQTLINAHKLEPNTDPETTHIYETTTYPPA